MSSLAIGFDKIDYDSGVIGRAATQGEVVAMEILSAAVRRNFSDIHFNPRPEGRVEVLVRQNGKLSKIQEIPLSLYRYVEVWLKGKAGIPKQDKTNWDGRIDYVCDDQKCAFRVATSWAVTGEATKITLRLLPPELDKMALEDLGFELEDLNAVKGCLEAARGIFLVSGPTGSGKTTTLYAALKYVKQDRHVLTIEDPVEAAISDVTQLEVKKGVVSFADHLKSALRHDPDVILVGEIRDEETARVSVSASMSGHLVLATLHANSCLMTVPRMVDLGADTFNLVFSLKGAIAQRLLPKNCEYCKEEAPVPEHLKGAFKRFAPGWIRDAAPGSHFYSRGCEYCNWTGVRGRRMIYELITFDGDDKRYVFSLLKEKKDFEREYSGYVREKYALKTMVVRALELVEMGEVSFASLVRYCL